MDPPFCKTCNVVGHDCEKKQVPKGAKKQGKKQWVPKKTTAAPEVPQDAGNPGKDAAGSSQAWL